MPRKRDYDPTGNALGPDRDISKFKSYDQKYDPKSGETIGKTETGKSFEYINVSGAGPQRGREILPTMKAMKADGRQATSKNAPSGRKPNDRGL